MEKGDFYKNTVLWKLVIKDVLQYYTCSVKVRITQFGTFIRATLLALFL